MAVVVTHTKTLVAPSTGSEDKVYGKDYVDPASHSIAGLGTLATQNGTFSGTSSGTNTGDQTNISGNAATVTTNANLSGDVTSVGNTTTLTNAPVIAKVLTGYTSGAGTVSATDSILQAIQKLNGNDALKAPLASPTFTGTVVAPAINGGIAANDDITIQGTSHATRTTSYVNLQPSGGSVGIGTTSPRGALDVVTTTDIYLSTFADYNIKLTGGDTFLVVRDNGAAANLYFQNANNAHTIINSGGSTGGVGIGMTPVRKLDVTGTFGVTGVTTFGAPATLKGYTVATLPAGTTGFMAYVTDALAPTFLAALVGGGAVVAPAFYNGGAWVGF